MFLRARLNLKERVQILSIIAGALWRELLLARRPRHFREIVARYGKPLILGGLTLYVAACTYAAAPNEFVLGAQLGTAARGAWEVGKIVLGRG